LASILGGLERQFLTSNIKHSGIKHNVLFQIGVHIPKENVDLNVHILTACGLYTTNIQSSMDLGAPIHLQAAS